MRQPADFTSTYEEMAETIRYHIRPCWRCEYQRTDACSLCPSSSTREDILGMLSYANKKLKEEGIFLSKTKMQPKKKRQPKTKKATQKKPSSQKKSSDEINWEELDSIDF